MKEFKGTKPPWRIDEYNPISIVDNTFSFSNLICQVNGKNSEERERNTKLIAAAPDLLEALQYFLEEGENRHTIKKAKEAINKALD